MWVSDKDVFVFSNNQPFIPNWRFIWQQATLNPTHQAIITLVLLNGLSIAQLKSLTSDAVDADNRYLLTPDGACYPLVAQAQDSLKNITAWGDTLFDATQIENLLTPHLEADAQRFLAGALWLTSEDGLLIREMTQPRETPILPLRFTFPFSVVNKLTPTSPQFENCQKTLQVAADWLDDQLLAPKTTLFKRAFGVLKSGQMIFLISSTGVSALNLIHNLVMGKLLSPADYGQLTLIITLQLLIGLLPTAMQTTIARFSATYRATHQLGQFSALQQHATRLALIIGVGIGVMLLVLSPLLAGIFQLYEAEFLIPLALVTPFFLLMGVHRGLLQGMGAFLWLSGAYLAEGVVRLAMSIVLALILYSALTGAIWGVAQSVIVSALISALAVRLITSQPPSHTPDDQKEWGQLGGLVLFSLIGQALITNSDFLLVKTFFSPTESGLYAAVSVLGRIAYFGALPITVIIVPLVARRQALGQPTQPIFALLMGAGGAMCGILLFFAVLFAPQILGILYGEAYTDAAAYLPLYTLTASLFVMTNLAITYRIALGKGSETWMPLVAGILQVFGIILFHESITQVIVVQTVLMSGLLGLVLYQILAPKPRDATLS